MIRWHDILDPQVADKAKRLSTRAEEERMAGKAVYPPQDCIFRALELTPPETLRCVILGQDPYHGKGQANGLAFSVNPGVKLPPSLRNIFKELQSDTGCPAPSSGDLTPWARQGVLLLNTALTVEEGRPKSHDHWGWQVVTHGILKATQTLPQPISFILWGSLAQSAADWSGAKETTAPRLFLEAPHPSPLSSYRGFFGSKPFSKTNEFLVRNGAEPICWTLP